MKRFKFAMADPRPYEDTYGNWVRWQDHEAAMKEADEAHERALLHAYGRGRADVTPDYKTGGFIDGAHSCSALEQAAALHAAYLHGRDDEEKRWRRVDAHNPGGNA